MATQAPDLSTGFAADDFNNTDLMIEVCKELFSNFSSICNDTNSTLNDTLDSTTSAPFVLPHELWLTIFLAISAGIVCIVTILGNILVLMSFVLERTIRQPTNYFIASLALSDLLIGTFSMPCFTLYLLLGYWPLGEIICDLWLSLDWTVCLASQYTVFFITADRFCSVKIPARYRNWRTENKVKVMIALSWIIPAVVFFTSIVGWQYFVGERTVADKQCEVQFMSDPLFTFLLTIGYYWTTLTVMIVLYMCIYRVALSLQQKAIAKQKKMNHAMEMVKEGAKKSKRSANKARKESKKRIENNNARYLRGQNDNTITTSFSKNSDAENSKPSEEDRSSSPAFASDDESIADDSRREKSKGKGKEVGYVNSAVQTERTLKGMLGTSFNHMSRLAFSISGTSVNTSQASQGSDKEVCEDNQTMECEANKPLLTDSKNSFKPIEEGPPRYEEVISTDDDKQHQSSTTLIENDILDGLKYIDEDSLKSLTSSENMKLLNEVMEKKSSKLPANELDSPVWLKRFPEARNPYLLPVTIESNIISDAESAYDADDNERTEVTRLNNISAIEDSNGSPSRTGKSSSSHHHHHHHHHHRNTEEHASHDHLAPQSSNHSSASNSKSKYGSPLQSLVKSLRTAKVAKPKATKSKSENRARKALRTISIILGAYLVCWTPYHIMVFIIGICGNWNCINLQLYYFTYWLCYLNSPINPFCYAFANAAFKRTFTRILKFDFHRT